MAGFLFNLDSEQSLKDSISKGIYSTNLTTPDGIWKTHHEATFTDYFSMKEGDNVFFFIKRKIYGIGILTNINDDCKFLNYPDANKPTVQNYKHIKNKLLFDIGGEVSLNYRFICTFIPSPFFFINGIDMDDILTSSPKSFIILRALWKRSFIKFTEEENQALKNILLRRNVNAIKKPKNKTFQVDYKSHHKKIELKLKNNNHYNTSIKPLLETIANNDGSIKHEMAIEAALVHQISSKDQKTVSIFGEWDYISHQVIASPFKPIDYMDKMDIFGYRYIENQKPTIHKFLVIEIKKGDIDKQDVIQLMKYVDWVKNEYAFGDYSMIDAFLVGFSFNKEVLISVNDIVERKYIYGVRPSVSDTWKNVKFIKYEYKSNNNTIDFSEHG